mmetsp:Transcript_16619/g.33722  ORF Transcript_16619/g.33722 Transcript_16619/m.33722 type:complete len:202 (-) Transcript_16619:386-991(-)
MAGRCAQAAPNAALHWRRKWRARSHTVEKRLLMMALRDDKSCSQRSRQWNCAVGGHAPVGRLSNSSFPTSSRSHTPISADARRSRMMVRETERGPSVHGAISPVHWPIAARRRTSGSMPCPPRRPRRRTPSQTRRARQVRPTACPSRPCHIPRLRPQVLRGSRSSRCGSGSIPARQAYLHCPPRGRRGSRGQFEGWTPRHR